MGYVSLPEGKMNNVLFNTSLAALRGADWKHHGGRRKMVPIKSSVCHLQCFLYLHREIYGPLHLKIDWTTSLQILVAPTPARLKNPEIKCQAQTQIMFQTHCDGWRTKACKAVGMIQTWLLMGSLYQMVRDFGSSLMSYTEKKTSPTFVNNLTK